MNAANGRFAVVVQLMDGAKRTALYMAVNQYKCPLHGWIDWKPCYHCLLTLVDRLQRDVRFGVAARKIMKGYKR